MSIPLSVLQFTCVFKVNTNGKFLEAMPATIAQFSFQDVKGMCCLAETLFDILDNDMLFVRRNLCLPETQLRF